ncbi:MAG TPA: PAS domain S-box protein [Jatrophihabitans sp.]|jgi:PAS domain S-box-containing protein/diguanylate cyclase (GGDEF)-like protein|uniref:PAS domain S-box protein n=1 Tax=Jatrophihabitans sp. TaxID=1932789 RepID=UPI002EE71458
MTEVPAGLSQLAEDALGLLGAVAVAVRRSAPDGVLETLALAGRNAEALVTGADGPIEPAPVSVRGRWRRREHAGPGELESHPITGATGRRLGWLTFERGPADAGRLGETALRLVLAHAGALLEAAELAARLSAQQEVSLQRLQELRIVDQALSVAFEESVVGMVMISLDPADAGSCLRVNDALCRLTGYTREQLLGRPFEQVTLPEDRALTASAMRRAMAGRRTPFRADKRYVRADGGIRWVRVTATPLFDDDDRPLYALGQVEDLSRREERDVELAARLDPLTGLLNSAALEEGLVETVQRAHRIGTGCAVLFAELDGWEELAAGQDESSGLADQLQQALAQRLQTTLRGSDVISRVGDNQFVIITEEVGPEQVEAVARRLKQALAAPEVIDGREFSMSANLGLSVLAGDPGDDAGQSATLLAQARTALAQARAVGGGSHVLYLSDGAQPANGMSRTLYAHPEWRGRALR